MPRSSAWTPPSSNAVSGTHRPPNRSPGTATLRISSRPTACRPSTSMATCSPPPPRRPNSSPWSGNGFAAVNREAGIRRLPGQGPGPAPAPMSRPPRSRRPPTTRPTAARPSASPSRPRTTTARGAPRAPAPNAPGSNRITGARSASPPPPSRPPLELRAVAAPTPGTHELAAVALSPLAPHHADRRATLTVPKRVAVIGLPAALPILAPIAPRQLPAPILAPVATAEPVLATLVRTEALPAVRAEARGATLPVPAPSLTPELVAVVPVEIHVVTGHGILLGECRGLDVREISPARGRMHGPFQRRTTAGPPTGRSLALPYISVTFGLAPRRRRRRQARRCGDPGHPARTRVPPGHGPIGLDRIERSLWIRTFSGCCARTRSRVRSPRKTSIT